jgi:hypothetical protein
MSESEWYGKALCLYFPSDMTDDMVDKIFKKYDVWLSASKENEKLEESLEEVKLLKSENDKESLIRHILAVCFLATLDDSFDMVSLGLGQAKELNKNIEKQRQPLKELSCLLEQCIDNPMMKTKFIEHGIMDKSKPKKNSSKLKISTSLLPPEILKLILDSYIENINLTFGCKAEEKNKINFLLRRSMGALVFDKDRRSNKYGKDTIQTPLCFNLAFLFRNFTRENDGHWLTGVNGNIPKDGNPHYSLVTSIVNAVLCKTGNTLDRIAVRDRTRYATEQGGRLGNWMGGSIWQ